MSILLRRVFCAREISKLLHTPSGLTSLCFHSSSRCRMKRKSADVTDSSPRKAPKVDDYCNVQPKRDGDGSQIWPAPEEQMTAARLFMREWYAMIDMVLFHMKLY